MRNYIIRRLFLMIPTVFLASIIIFFMIRLIPGNVVDLILTDLDLVTPAQRSQLMHELGLDVPVFTQYGRWIGVWPQDDGSFGGIFQGDLGNSLWTRAPVIDEVATRWPVTLELSFMALIIAQLIALPVGLYSALRQDTVGDYLARSLAILCIAIPGFWLGTMIIVFPSIWWGWSPPIMLIPFTDDPIGNLKMFILPAIVLGMLMSGQTMRLTRTMMLEVLRQDYIRTAWAKGLRERVVVIRHALKNALIPVITLIGLQMPFVVGGSVIIEHIFCLPGMGGLFYEAAHVRDYPTISGVMVLFAIVIVFINLMVDLIYAYLDPRVRYR